MKERRIYKVIFLNQGQVYEIYAKGVNPGPYLGFIEVEEVLFGERSQVVLDPSEESLKREFDGVRRTYVPIHAVVRIDEVAKPGVCRITPSAKGDGTLTPFPSSIYPEPGKDPTKS
jgi:hypothetical protein